MHEVKLRKLLMNYAEMLEKVATASGFIAALDQSGGSTPKALRGYGVEEDAYTNEEEMFALIHDMRTRIITAPSFSGDKVLGAILFERTMDGDAGGKTVPTALQDRGVVPFLKVDKGLEDEADGVQLMKPIPELGARIAAANKHGVFGTKMRSVINMANPSGIDEVVKQQFEVGKEIIAGGLVPIIEPEVNIKSAEKAEAEEILKKQLIEQANSLNGDQNIMLKLSLPTKANLYKELVDHPRVVRVVALSGGYSREVANQMLAENNGVIASFSRALAEGLSAQQSDTDFDAMLNGTIQSIYEASIK